MLLSLEVATAFLRPRCCWSPRKELAIRNAWSLPRAKITIVVVPVWISIQSLDWLYAEAGDWSLGVVGIFVVVAGFTFKALDTRLSLMRLLRSATQSRLFRVTRAFPAR